MTTTRQELEVKLAAFAAVQTQPLLVSYENVPFERPVGAMWLECFIGGGNIISTSIDASRNRERGTFIVNCWSPSGQGTNKVEALAAQIVSLYKVIPKTGNVSIESPGDTKKIMLDVAGWVCIQVSFSFRVESVA